jgi:hypothetical protein
VKLERVLKILFKEVKVTGDEVISTYNTPTATGLLEEALPILYMVQDGGRAWTRTFKSNIDVCMEG